MECYQKVRDAALDWEFHQSNGNELGILPLAHVTKPLGNPLRLPWAGGRQRGQPILRGRYTITPIPEDDGKDATSNPVVPLHHCLGAARRFVSYSSRKLVPFIGSWSPEIFAINPVRVVYDVVDQRGPATTFTSTAFATLPGHLLRGEERVTVAWRDGTDQVDVEIVSVSRAGPSWKGRALWPFIGKMQSTFFESQLDNLFRIGQQSTSSSSGQRNRVIFPSSDNVMYPLLK